MQPKILLIGTILCFVVSLVSADDCGGCKKTEKCLTDIKCELRHVHEGGSMPILKQICTEFHICLPFAQGYQCCNGSMCPKGYGCEGGICKVTVEGCTPPGCCSQQPVNCCGTCKTTPQDCSNAKKAGLCGP